MDVGQASDLTCLQSPERWEGTGQDRASHRRTCRLVQTAPASGSGEKAGRHRRCRSGRKGEPMAPLRTENPSEGAPVSGKGPSPTLVDAVLLRALACVQITCLPPPPPCRSPSPGQAWNGGKRGSRSGRAGSGSRCVNRAACPVRPRRLYAGAEAPPGAQLQSIRNFPGERPGRPECPNRRHEGDVAQGLLPGMPEERMRALPVQGPGASEHTWSHAAPSHLSAGSALPLSARPGRKKLLRCVPKGRRSWQPPPSARGQESVQHPLSWSPERVATGTIRFPGRGRDR